MRARARWLPALALALACGLALPAANRAPSHARHAHHARRHRSRGQVGIIHARARQIQAALARVGYLHHASGRWDAATRAAMRRYQRDHQWQVRYVPDSRALIALGLGPKYDAPPAVAKTAVPVHPPGS